MTYASRIMQASALALALSTLAILVFPAIIQALQDRPTRTCLSIVPSRVELGAVPQGRQVAFQFSLHNNGSQCVDNVRVMPSCGCTLVNSGGSSMVRARESLRVEGVFDASNVRGRKVTHILVGWATGTRAEEKIVTIEADIIPVISVTPSHLAFDAGESVKEPSTITKSIELRVSNDCPFTIDDLRWSHPAIDVTERNAKAKTQHDVSAILDVTFDPHHPIAGALAGTSHIEVRTSVSSEPRIRIPIKIGGQV